MSTYRVSAHDTAGTVVCDISVRVTHESPTEMMARESALITLRQIYPERTFVIDRVQQVVGPVPSARKRADQLMLLVNATPKGQA